MSREHEPRADDHLVEPMYSALRKRDGTGRSGTASESDESSPRASNGDWRWKILWAIVGALAIGYVVWRQAF